MSQWEGNTNFNRREKRNAQKWIISGIIPKLVGFGENAKTSLLVIVVILAFITICIAFIASIIYDGYFRAKGEIAPCVVNTFNTIWDTVSPIIILALGYQFGKNQNKR